MISFLGMLILISDVAIPNEKKLKFLWSNILNLAFLKKKKKLIIVFVDYWVEGIAITTVNVMLAMQLNTHVSLKCDEFA